MENGREWVVFGLSLYVVFFVIAFMQAMPSSFQGSVAGPVSVAERCVQSADCDLATTAEREGQKPGESQFNGNQARSVASGDRTLESCRGAYYCALLTGASYN